MEYKKVSNEQGLELEILTGSEDYEAQWGGDDRNPTWEQYLADYRKEYQPHVELIKEAIIQNDLLGYTGQQADELSFKFSDGQHWGYTWRAWGDLMQSIIDEQEGYMKYYL